MEIQASMYVRPCRFTSHFNVSSWTFRKAGSTNMKRMQGGSMRGEYIVLGAIAVFAIAVGVSLLPDFVRYMKIRSM